MTKPIKKRSSSKVSTKRVLQRKKIKTSSKKKYVDNVKSVSYQDYLIESLKDPNEAAGYLNAALSGGDIRVFLLALQNVVQAQGGITALAEKTKKSRTSLYKSLSEEGNPYLKSVSELLAAMGMHLAAVPNEKRTSI